MLVKERSHALDYQSGAGEWAGRDTRIMPAVVLLDRFTEAVKHLGMYWLLLNEIPPHGASGGGV